MNDKYIKLSNEVYKNKTLNSTAKLLYGKIVLMCHQYGYCYATNQFFAEELNLSKRTITTLISKLKNENLIRVELGERYIRKIFIIE